MPRNVEIKAKVYDLPQLLNVAKRLSGENGTILRQKDFFYQCDKGRLKLRSIKTDEAADHSQLIFYQRSDKSGPKLSDFIVTPVPEPEDMNRILSASLGSDGVVVKKRTLFMIGQTRVHVDVVEGLGDFMELEVQLRDDQTTDDGVKIANELMIELGVKEIDLVTGAYHDLLKGKRAVA